jgi:predicted nuclease of predicted toxin-antitoxin system
VRFLIDEALQDAVAYRLAEEGHDASHVRALGLAGCTDNEVMALALAEERVLVTTDTDFGTILALTGAAGPSVLLLRGVGDSTPERVAALLTVLPRVADELSQGAVVVVEEDRYRIRHLPIDDS